MYRVCAGRGLRADTAEGVTSDCDIVTPGALLVMSWLSRLCQCTSRPRSGSHHQVVDRETPKHPSQPAQSGDIGCDDGTLCLATLVSCSGCFALNERTSSHIKILSQNLHGITEENHKVINYPRQHNNLLLLDWTTCFVQLIGHPQVLLYCEVFRQQCARFGIASAFM